MDRRDRRLVLVPGTALELVDDAIAHDVAPPSSDRPRPTGPPGKVSAGPSSTLRARRRGVDGQTRRPLGDDSRGSWPTGTNDLAGSRPRHPAGSSAKRLCSLVESTEVALGSGSEDERHLGDEGDEQPEEHPRTE